LAPKTQYAKKGEVSIAYQVIGDGPIDLILVNGIMAHMDLIWAEPQGNAVLRQLASFARLILFDKPGTGLSDPVVGPHRLSSGSAISAPSWTRRGRSGRR
jgi:pimeloyl-ACP methyl ester carboxylesterase